MSKQTKITKSARGRDCEIQLEGVCNFNPETVIFCHLGGGGMGMKSSDLHGAYGCYDCHMVIDGHAKSDFSQEELELRFFQAMIRTQIILLALGLVRIN